MFWPTKPEDFAFIATNWYCQRQRRKKTAKQKNIRRGRANPYREGHRTMVSLQEICIFGQKKKQKIFFLPQAIGICGRNKSGKLCFYCRNSIFSAKQKENVDVITGNWYFQPQTNGKLNLLQEISIFGRDRTGKSCFYCTKIIVLGKKGKLNFYCRKCVFPQQRRKKTRKNEKIYSAVRPIHIGRTTEPSFYCRISFFAKKKRKTLFIYQETILLVENKRKPCFYCRIFYF